MKPELAVITDQLRTLGLEDVARWVEHPEAVRVLLESRQTHAITSLGEYEGESCDYCATHSPRPCERECRIAAAWRALGDLRGAADIERAHEEALRQDANRNPNLFGVEASTYGLARLPTTNSDSIDALEYLLQSLPSITGIPRRPRLDPTRPLDGGERFRGGNR